MGGVVAINAMEKVYIATEREFGIDRKFSKAQFESLEPMVSTNKLPMRELWKRLAEKLKISDGKRLEKLWKRTFVRDAKLNNSVVKLVKKIRNPEYKTALLSNTIKVHEAVHRKRGDYKLFPKVFLSTHVGLTKPDVRIYKYAARKLGVKPGECIFIDDKITNVKGARKAGMKSILFKNSIQLERDLKKYGIL